MVRRSPRGERRSWMAPAVCGARLGQARRYPSRATPPGHGSVDQRVPVPADHPLARLRRADAGARGGHGRAGVLAAVPVSRAQLRQRADRRGAAHRTRAGRPAPPRVAGGLPYPVAGGYVLLDEPRDLTFGTIPADHENAALNAGYVVQWWAFALLTLIGFGWAARREAHGADRFDLAELYTDHPDAPVSPAI